MKTIILGAGISGLTVAYTLQKAQPDADITLLEKSNTSGGWIKSHIQDNFVLEQGPRGIRPKGKGQNTLKLIEEIGLMNRLIIANPEAKRRFIFNNGLQEFPKGLLSLIQSPLRNTLISALKKDFTINSFPFNEENLAQFSNRHFGESFTDNILQPVVSGIWGGNIHKLSAMATIPKIVLLEQKEGSLLKSFLKHRPQKKPWAFSKILEQATLISFPNGLQELPKRLAEILKKHIHYNTNIQKITQDKSTFLVNTETDTYQANRIISAIPAHALSLLIFDLDKALSHKLSQITYAPMAVVTLAFKHTVHTCKGFGYLNRQQDSKDILGVIFNEQTFPEHASSNEQSLTVMMGGALYPDFSSMCQDEWIDKALVAISSHLNITAKPDITLCKIIPKAIPQYNMGYLQIIESLQKHCPLHFHLTGNYMGGVSVIDTIAHAQRTIDHIKQ
jgi:oxygen-dependent protoporphyrinogen oxidase